MKPKIKAYMQSTNNNSISIANNKIIFGSAMDNSINGNLVGLPGEILSSESDSDEEHQEKRRF